MRRASGSSRLKTCCFARRRRGPQAGRHKGLEAVLPAFAHDSPADARHTGRNRVPRGPAGRGRATKPPRGPSPPPPGRRPRSIRASRQARAAAAPALRQPSAAPRAAETSRASAWGAGTWSRSAGRRSPAQVRRSRSRVRAPRRPDVQVLVVGRLCRRRAARRAGQTLALTHHSVQPRQGPPPSPVEAGCPACAATLMGCRPRWPTIRPR